MGHKKFKLFQAEFAHGSFDTTEARDFINQNDVVPRSLGVEFLEANNTVLVSVGYDTDELTGDLSHDIILRKVGELSDGFKKIEASMGEIASEFDGVVCHEFFVNHGNEVFSLFLVKI